MVTVDYITNELEKLDRKSARNRNGLYRFDLERQEKLIDALKFIKCRNAFEEIDKEFSERTNGL